MNKFIVITTIALTSSLAAVAYGFYRLKIHQASSVLDKPLTEADLLKLLNN